MVETADLLLPDATFLEKWDLDTRNLNDFHQYVGLRQPVVLHSGECRDIRDNPDILISLAKAIDEEMAGHFLFENAKEFIELWARPTPGGLECLQKEGIWIDEHPYVPKNNSFQFHLEKLGRKPMYSPILKHKEMTEDELILTTFKWNVHTQSRKANQQWLTEIVDERIGVQFDLIRTHKPGCIAFTSALFCNFYNSFNVQVSINWFFSFAD